MTQPYCAQLRLILWKNYLLRRRRPVQIIVELVVPLLIFLILVWVRTRNLLEERHACHYEAWALPSAGTVPFVRSIVCSAQRQCYKYATSSDIDMSITPPDSLSIFLTSIEEVLTNETEVGSLVTLIDEYKKVNSIRSPSEYCQASLYESLLDVDQLQKTLHRRNVTVERLNELFALKINIPEVMAKYPMLLKPLNNSDNLDGIAMEFRRNVCLLNDSIILGPPETIQYFCSLDNRTEIILVEEMISSTNASALNQYLLNCFNISTLDYISRASVIQEIAKKIADLDSGKKLVADLNVIASGRNKTSDSSMLFKFLCARSSNGESDVHYSSSNGTHEANSIYCDRKPDLNDSSISMHCNNLFDDLRRNPQYCTVWKIVEPMVRGQILFTPDNAVTRSIIHLANETFVNIANVLKLAHSWLKISPTISKVLNDSTLAFIKKTLMQNPSLAPHLPLLNNDTDELIASVSSIAKSAIKFLECFNFQKFQPVKSEQQLIKQSVPRILNNTFFAGVVFDIPENATTIPSLVKYKIRMNVDIIDSTRNFKVLDRYWEAMPRDNIAIDMRYLTSGFIFIQDMVESAIVKLNSKTNVSQVGIYVQQFPYPCYIRDKFMFGVRGSLPLFMILSWVYTVAMLVKSIVYEKELRLHEVMQVMGMRRSVHWLASFIIAFIMMTLSAVLLVILLKVGGVLIKSNAFALCFFFNSFTIAVITFCFMLSTFFSKANVASACCGIIYFCAYLPYGEYVIFHEESMSFLEKICFCLLTPVSFGFGCNYIAQYESSGEGLQWNNIHLSPGTIDNFSILSAIGMLWVNSCIHCIVTWYMQNAFPGAYGIGRPWYFPFLCSYWWHKKNSASKVPPALDDGALPSSDICEPASNSQRLGVSIIRLSKMYAGSNKFAVDNLSLDFYESQITSFLGHNGAGKTTTMSIMCGLFPPTSGTIEVYGSDVCTDLDNVRSSMGICPQHNVLFDKLTVQEHLVFYGLLKGADQASLHAEINRTLEDVGLVQKRNTLTHKLSGGMKRKLSVAIAFISNSKVVILDEPTAGVDPYARRSIWDLLLKYKSSRTIILSTHFMDEADTLGDRIAIINQGTLCCVGSSIFLKKKFGSGYHMTLVLKDFDSSASQKKANEIFDDRIKKLNYFMSTFLSSVQLIERVGFEVFFKLDSTESLDENLSKMFDRLDQSLEELGVSSYGISDTALEEVFLKVAEEKVEQKILPFWSTNGLMGKIRWVMSKIQEKPSQNPLREEEVEASDDEDPSARSSFHEGGMERQSGLRLKLQQLHATYYKNFHYTRRSVKGFFVQIVLPAIFVLISLTGRNLHSDDPNDPIMELHPWLMLPHNAKDRSLSVFFSKYNSSLSWAKDIDALIQSSPGIGNRCLDPEVHRIHGFPCSSSSGAYPPSSLWTQNSSKPCSCATGHQVCPEGAVGALPVRKQLITTDYLYNLSSRNITDWLRKTEWDFKEHRYGGFSVGHKGSKYDKALLDVSLKRILAAFNGGTPLSSSFNLSTSDFIKEFEQFLETAITAEAAKVWFNNKGYASVVAYTNAFYNFLLRRVVAKNKVDSYGIVAHNHPMNRTRQQLSYYLRRAGNAIGSISVLFAMSFVPASFVLFIVDERISDSKHLQLASGLSKNLYWISNFSWHMLNYLIPMCLCIIIFVAFNEEAFISAQNAPCLILLFFLYGWAMTPLMYIGSFIFSVPSTAFVGLSCFNILIGLISTLSTFIIDLLKDEDKKLEEVNSYLTVIFLAIPHYCFGRGLVIMSTDQIQADIMYFLGLSVDISPLAWDKVGRNLLCLFLEGIVFFLLVLSIENSVFSFLRRKPKLSRSMLEPVDDDDVITESNRITSNGGNNDILRVENLIKMYGRNTAVSGLTFGVHRGECFGLLGNNGAGKTSTFQMLTGKLSVTGGDAYLENYSVKQQLNQVQSLMGYCPQFDALCSLMTGREHLKMYAMIRGIQPKEIPQVCNWAISNLSLTAHADKCVGNYSGGNKRKLSTAIALIGNAPLIILDEPTTGMDPKARRFLWNRILQIVKAGRSVVLTSHSMEECEVLCSRLAIMVNGQFKCFGTVQHLKNKFGEGYTVTLRGRREPLNLAEMELHMTETFNNINVLEAHHNMLRIQIPLQHTLAKIFRELATAKQKLELEDYSVTQTTLEQVFVRFAKQQKAAERNIEFINPGFLVTSNEAVAESTA